MITWNTDVNAPRCPGEIVNDDGRTILIQTDWDFPGVAGSFGWSLKQVQKCPACGHIHDVDDAGLDDKAYCHNDGASCRCIQFTRCDHDGTDGTVDCEECGVTNSQFISAAYDWLRANDGLTAFDPGYFDNGE